MRLHPDKTVYGQDYTAYADIDPTYRPSNPGIGVFVTVVRDNGHKATVEVSQAEFDRFVQEYLFQRGKFSGYINEEDQ